MSYLLQKIRYTFCVQRIPNGTHLIVGLGNPGKIYENTRHNVGQQFVKHLANEFAIKMNDGSNGSIGQFQHIILFNPLSFMNSSGHPIKKLADKANIATSNIIVVHDDLENLPGRCKIKQGGSAEGHNGLKSIIQYMDDKFIRLKIGIGRPNSKDPAIVSDYVMSKLDYEPSQQAFKQGIMLARQLFKF
ncbi:unnamed protein product [Paramecium primaurelia]|uniref:peptidyl-tRNA hydrolase n=1 Tax=Paramecium primaurelia TaxID=5886 RepID=A0A8S1QDB5_PARPR|nr:unnamed protein product [Paramecium primaurelia]